MSAYIKITMANDLRCAINYGLRQVLCYISREETGFVSLTFDPVLYKKGVEIIDRRLRRWCKTSINHLVYCKKGKNDEKYVWKIHRTKAVKILHAIRYELKKKKAPAEIYNLFQQIYIFLFNLLNGDVRRTKSEVLSRAFIRGIYSALQNPLYSDAEKKSLKCIMDAFDAYNKDIF